MTVTEVIADAIITDFLQPTIERLGEQLRRNIEVSLKIAFGNESLERHIISSKRDHFDNLVGEVRVLTADTAISGRYKYDLQCLFPQQDDLKGFSGLRLNGAVVTDGAISENKYSGFIYTYNEWLWGKKFRDL